MRGWIIGIATFVAIVIIASEMGVDASTVGREMGEAFSYGFSALSGFFGGLFGGGVSEAVG